MMHIALSTNNGSSYVTILNVTAAHNFAYWMVPEIECMGARLRLTLEHTGGTAICSNVNSFFIFTETVYNQPPLAVVGNSQSVLEGTLVTLDGSDSYDPNNDPLTYEWLQVDGSGFDVTLSNQNAAVTTFTPNIRDYAVELIFQLTVSDGQDLPYHYVDHLARTSVLVTPTGPSISGFTPEGGWEGGWVKITGTNLMGGQVRIGGVLTATVPTTPSPNNPDPGQPIQLHPGPRDTDLTRAHRPSPPRWARPPRPRTSRCTPDPGTVWTMATMVGTPPIPARTTSAIRGRSWMTATTMTPSGTTST